MTPIAEALRERGHHVYLLELAGHEVPISSDASAARWREQLDCALNSASETYPGATLTGVGFSTGGTLWLDAVNRQVAPLPEELILFSPAITTNPAGIILRVLTKILPGWIPLPSLTPRDYRTGIFTPLYGYKALFEIQESLSECLVDAHFEDISLTTVMSESDLVVYPSYAWKWLRKLPWKDFEELHVTPKPSISFTYGHLIIDEPTIGKEEWHRFLQSLDE